MSDNNLFLPALKWSSDYHYSKKDTADDIAYNLSTLMDHCDNFFKMMRKNIENIENTLESNQNDINAIKTLLENKEK